MLAATAFTETTTTQAMNASSDAEYGNFREWCKTNAKQTVGVIDLAQRGEATLRSTLVVVNVDESLAKISSTPVVVRTSPVLFHELTREGWMRKAAELKGNYPFMSVLGMQGARKLAKGRPCGHLINFESSSGYWLSLGTVADKYKKSLSTPGPVPTPTPADMPTAPAYLIDNASASAAPMAIAVPVASPVATARSASPPKKKSKQCCTSVEQMLLQHRPTDVHKLLRTAARCTPLLKFLKQRGCFEIGHAQWKAVREWTRTSDGVAWLKEAGLSADSVSLDHIIARDRGGVDSVYNCAFVPLSLNSHFGSVDVNEKEPFLGDACVIAKRFARWTKNKVEASKLDQSAFDPNVD
jgi:hypothetical protein